MIGFAMTGSFCSIPTSLILLKKLAEKGCEIVPIMSDTLYKTDIRIGTAEDIRKSVKDLTDKEIIHTIVGAEPLGPKSKLDALVICPCTGNTLAKIANGITDTAVCMAAKAHLRNDKPLIIALASNDALSANLQNIAKLLSRKNVYFVPMTQDDPQKKPHSLVFDSSYLFETIEHAQKGIQVPKIFI
jgi:dipicolinate synthase subunit B